MKNILSFVVLLFSSIIVFSCQESRDSSKQRIPVLVFTDFGRDVDDAEAFTYLADNESLEIVGVVCGGYISEIRASSLSSFLKLLHVKTAIAVGHDLPMGVNDSSIIADYLSAHSMDGVPYEMSLRDSLAKWEGTACFNEFHNPMGLMDSLLNRYDGELRMVILSQATDFATYFELNPQDIEKVHSIYIQGQAMVAEDGKLLPDPASYNMREDLKAASILFSFQEQVPFILLGKYATYPMAYTPEEFALFAGRHGKAGDYLLQAAYKGLENFAFRDSADFYQVFNISDSFSLVESLERVEKISNPYDIMTVLLLDREDLFVGKRVGRHLLVGLSPGACYFRDSMLIKNILLKENY